jgi:hypothetical protein
MWQPIETAPKDGETPVLLAGGRTFCEERNRYLDYPVTGTRLDGESWLVVGVESGYVWVTCDKPTHWQPVPELP